MRGIILSYDLKSNTGLISGDDGNRYEFHALDWNLSTKPTQGLKVYFEQDGKKAKNFILITEKKQESFVTKVLFVSVLLFFGYYFFSAITYLGSNGSPDVKANNEAIKRSVDDMRSKYCEAYEIECDASPNVN
jgi:hypothetical protein